MRGKEAVGVCGGVVTVFLRVETGWLVGIVISGALVLGAEVGGGVGRKSVMARSSRWAVWWTGRGPGSAGVGGSGRRGAGTAGGGERLPAPDILGSGLGSRGPPAGDCLPPLAGLRDLDFKKLLNPFRLLIGRAVVGSNGWLVATDDSTWLVLVTFLGVEGLGAVVTNVVLAVVGSLTLVGRERGLNRALGLNRFCRGVSSDTSAILSSFFPSERDKARVGSAGSVVVNRFLMPGSTRSTGLPGFCLLLKREFLVLGPVDLLLATGAFRTSSSSACSATLTSPTAAGFRGSGLGFGLLRCWNSEFLDLGSAASCSRTGIGAGTLDCLIVGTSNITASGSPGCTTVGDSVAIRPGKRAPKRVFASSAESPFSGRTGERAGCSGPKCCVWGRVAKVGTGARFSVSPTIFTFGMNFEVKIFFLFAGMEKSPALPEGLLVSATPSPLLVASSSALLLIGVTRTELAGLLSGD